MVHRRTFMTGIAAMPIAMQGNEFNLRSIEPSSSAYAQAVLATGATRWLYISGQVPADQYGKVPDTFMEQARLVWSNLHEQLLEANMNWRNLVKVTVYLAARDFRAENTIVRREVLGELFPAITVIIADIFDEAWLLEIDAVAAA